MKNIFAKFQEYIKKPKRNVFDMTFRNNLTLKFGELTPVFCKEVIPGDSFKIDTEFGLMLMPMKFPVQTPMKAFVHYFYVRNRNTWKDWMDFIGGTKDNLVPPYVQPLDKKKFYRVGGLADYLGVPNVLYTDEAPSESLQVPTTPYSFEDNDLPSSLPSNYFLINYGNASSINAVYPNLQNSWYHAALIPFASANASWIIPDSAISGLVVGKSIDDSYQTNLNTDSVTLRRAYSLDLEDSGNSIDSEDVSTSSAAYMPTMFLGDYDVSYNHFEAKIEPSYYNEYLSNSYKLGGSNNNKTLLYLLYYNDQRQFNYVKSYEVNYTLIEGTDNVNMVLDIPSSDIEAAVLRGSIGFHVAMIQKFAGNNTNGVDQSLLPQGATNKVYVPITGNIVVKSTISFLGNTGVIGDQLPNTPYDSAIHLNALPFRAYEAIYNSYYRNPQNNPFILNGVPEYNRYITNNEGGADYTQYDLYFRNWEYDFLTSAVQSPQQGVAPLVGMSVTGEATFADEEGNTYYAQAILNDDGEITGWQSHSSNMPAGSLRLLMDMAGTGISINDLRNVNAFQRFLENNIRHGLKYRDQIMSHFGVKVRFDELDMPEFIGGCSAEMEVYKVSQTSEGGDTPLGSFVGQAQVKKVFGHSVTHYCDEHGYILGIMSIVPVPVYSQLLPKHFLKASQLDYFFPEFGHIGYQPILQKEVSPLQTYYANSDLNRVFGYNRAWYDYLASVDEVHAQFRTTMRDFIMNRTFDKREPELGEEFLLVDPDQLNDVFLAGTDDNDLYAPEADKIIGSLLFQVSAKRPIPLFGIPKLEA